MYAAAMPVNATNAVIVRGTIRGFRNMPTVPSRPAAARSSTAINATIRMTKDSVAPGAWE